MLLLGTDMKLINKLQSEFDNIHLGISALFSIQKNQVENDVPYVNQFANPNYAEKILKEGVDKASDPNWKDTGATSPEECAKWVLTTCGMACTSMALQYFKKRTEGIITLARDAKTHGVYKEHNHELSSMHYKEFVDWVKSYGTQAKVYTRLSIRGLQKLLSAGDIVIVSVNPNIREYETVSDKQRGGHLVLVTGYNKTKNYVTIHNPSGFASQNTQQNHIVTVPKFLKYYARRGITLSHL